MQLDRPISPHELWRDLSLRRPLAAQPGNAVFAQTLARLVPWRRVGKIARHTFVHREGRRSEAPRVLRRLPHADDHAAFVERKLARQGIGAGRTVFWTHPRDFAFPALVQKLAPPLVVADFTDDHRAWPGIDAGRAERIERNYREILAVADLVLTNCDAMRDAIAVLGGSATVVASGFEAPIAKPPCPRELAKLARPIVGYVGNLSTRIDVRLVARLAERLPHASIVLIGPSRPGDEIESLARHRNVHRLGLRRHPKVLSYAAHFDVAILPHRDEPLTRSMAPLKLGTYCAAGVPVVSTRVANLGPLAAVIEQADGDAFLVAVERALREPPTPERVALRARLLAEGSWERRAEEALALLDAAWERRHRVRT